MSDKDDILERLEDLRIFVRDNSYRSPSTFRESVELYSDELLTDIDDATALISQQQAVVDAARARCNRTLGLMGANTYDMGCRNTARDILRALDGEP